ncbi:MAG: hypothetical protein LBQ01_03470 [Prevotellaceae bacterium]|nr:hypothetical protein [Prevotellaceae bacterium]
MHLTVSVFSSNCRGAKPESPVFYRKERKELRKGHKNSSKTITEKDYYKDVTKSVIVNTRFVPKLKA